VLGRIAHTESPGFGGTTVKTTRFYDNAGGGYLYKSVTTVDGTAISAPLIVEYDKLGNVVRSGIDFGDDGVLDESGPDRITEEDSRYVSLGGQVWMETTTAVFRGDPNDTGATVQSIERYRLTGLDTNSTLSIRESEDSFGNVTRTTVTVDPAHALITTTVDYPASEAVATSVTHNGLLVSATDRAGVSTEIEYDGFGRRKVVTAGLIETEFFYDAFGRTSQVQDGAGHSVFMEYFGSSATDTAGRLKWIKNANDHYTRYDYDVRGNVTHVWGDVPIPVEMEYDEFGRQTDLRTYRTTTANLFNGTDWPTNPGTADWTTWTYDNATGLLLSKLYPDGSNVSYDYYGDGKLKERVWADQRTTTYAYFDNPASPDDFTGELRSVTYDDGFTATIGFEYNRVGEVDYIKDAAGERYITSSAHYKTIRESFDPESLFGDLALKRSNEDLFSYTEGMQVLDGTLLRLAKLEIGDSTDIDAHYAAEYDYEVDSARLKYVGGPGLPTGSLGSGAHYEYLADTHLLQRIKYKQGSTIKGRTIFSYDADRHLLESIDNQWPNNTQISKYAYQHDEIGRRKTVVRTGSAFATANGGSGQPHHLKWGYDPRNQLLSENRYDTNDPNTANNPVETNDRAYTYDPVGNRLTSYEGDPNTGTSRAYVVNNLNQYASVRNVTVSAGQGHRFDIDGNLVELFVAGDVDRDGDLDGDDPNAFWLSYGLCSGQGGYNPYADMDGDNCVGLGDYTLLSSYTGVDAIWVDLAYDGENRLVRHEPRTHVTGEQLVTYTYDYLGRRIERKVFDWDLGDPNTAEDDDWAGTPTEHTKFVWSGWLLLLELDGLSDDAVLRKYTWGLDLAGRSGGHSMESAGGIGGLLGVFETQGTSDPNDDKSYIFNYDGNGNVSELIDISDGSIAAHYEYDAFGRELVATGPYAAANHFRFSTKWRDPITGLLDYGRRWYDPRTGRWINRDPLEEAGGLNLYGFVGNEPQNAVDPVGMEGLEVGVNAHSGELQVFEPESGEPIGTLDSANPGFVLMRDSNGVPRRVPYSTVSDAAQDSIWNLRWDPDNYQEWSQWLADGNIGMKLDGSGVEGIKSGQYCRDFAIADYGKDHLGADPASAEDAANREGATQLIKQVSDDLAWFYATAPLDVLSSARTVGEAVTLSRAARSGKLRFRDVGTLENAARTSKILNEERAATAAGRAAGRACDGASGVWSMRPFDRGVAIENAFGHNLPKNFPVIDKWSDGVATSIKSLDLSARSYQDTRRLTGTLEGYVGKVAGFNGRAWGGMSIDASQIVARELQLVIPNAGTAAQQAAIHQVVTNAAAKGVRVVVSVYP